MSIQSIVINVYLDSLYMKSDKEELKTVIAMNAAKLQLSQI